MSKEKIDLKSVKKLNISGTPVKKSSGNKWKNKATADNRNKAAGRKSEKNKSNAKDGKNNKYITGGKKNKFTEKNENAGKEERSLNSRIKKTEKNGRKLQVPSEWLYLGEETDSLLRLKSTCINICAMNVEYWEEAEVIEASVADFSMDIEKLSGEDIDEDLTKYCNTHNMNFVAAVTIRAESYADVCNRLRQIQENAGGYFCIDNGRYESV